MLRMQPTLIAYFCHCALFDRFCSSCPDWQTSEPVASQPSTARPFVRRDGRACPCRQRPVSFTQHRVPLRNSRDRTLIAASISLLVLTSSLRKLWTTLRLFSLWWPLFCRSPYPAITLPPIELHGKSRADLNSCLQLHHDSCSASRLSPPELPTQAWARRRILKRFPSLQDMEALLFELLWVGQMLLSSGLPPGLCLSVIFGGVTA